MMKKVLIIGGNSFLGGAIVNRFVNNKKFDLFTTYRKNKNSRLFIEGLDKKCKTLQLDVTKLSNVKKLLKDIHPDIIIDLTSLVDVNKSINLPKESFESSAITTLNILEAIRLENLNSVYINHSSDKVYVNNEPPFNEEMKLFPNDIYGVGKLSQELISNSYNFHYGIKNINIRSANYYGPYDFDFNRLIPYLMKSYIQNEEISLRTNLEFKRDFLFIDEASKVNELICNLVLDNGFLNFGESFNFSQEKNYSIEEIINAISGMSKNNPEIKINNIESNFEAKKLLLDCSKSKEELGWQNTTTFEDGIEKTYNFYYSFLNNN